MNAFTFPKIVMAIFAGILWVEVHTEWTFADGEKPPHIAGVMLRDFDLLHEIPPSTQAKKLQTLRPLTTPGYEALRSAYWSGGPNHPAALLANGADPNLKSKEGEPILHYAVWLGNLDKLDDLLQAGADPNATDQYGQTALHSAVSRGQAGTVKLLLRYGANPERKSRDGTSPLEDAQRQEKKEIVALLQAKPVPPLVPRGISLPKVQRQPDVLFGSARFRAAGGGQALIYSADGKQLIAGDERGGLRFFDAQTGLLRNVFSAHDHAVLGLARIPNSRLIVTAGDDQTTRFWNIDSSQELMRLRWGTHALAASPDSRFIYTGYHLWHIESVAPLKLARRGLEIKDPNPSVGSRWSFFTPDSRYLVIGREGSGIWVWNLQKELLHKLDKATTKAITWQDLAAVCDIGTAPPTDLLALLSDQYTILTAPPAVLTAFTRAVPADGYARVMACSPDGQYLATLGYDSRIDVYDLENQFRKLKHDGHTAAVLSVCASPDGKLIASGSNDQTARIWDRATGKQVTEIPVRSFVYSVRFSPDSRILAIGDDNSNVHLWDIKERTLQTLSIGGRITDLAFTRSGDLIVLGWDIHVVDVTTGATKAKISAASAAQGTIAVSPQGVIVGSANSVGADETFKVPGAWLLKGDKLSVNKDLFSEAMGHRSFIHGVAFSPDGALLAASSEQAIRLWDMKKRQPHGTKMCGHTCSVNYLRFSPDGKWLASGSWDGTARIWEVATGRQVLLLDADVDRVSCLDFTPDGHLLTANWDGTVHEWDLPKHLKPASTR